MEETIDLKNILRILYKGLKWLVVCTLLGVLVMFVVSKLILTPQYRSEVSLYVTNTDSANNLNVNDINASQKLIDTYIVILQQDEVMAQVANEVALTMPCTYNQVWCFLSLSFCCAPCWTTRSRARRI